MSVRAMWTILVLALGFAAARPAMAGVVVDMPPPPPGAKSLPSSEYGGEAPPSLGEIALHRYAFRRSFATDTYFDQWSRFSFSGWPYGAAPFWGPWGYSPWFGFHGGWWWGYPGWGFPYPCARYPSYRYGFFGYGSWGYRGIRGRRGWSQGPAQRPSRSAGGRGGRRSVAPLTSRVRPVGTRVAPAPSRRSPGGSSLR
jgi:hypothetical protein